MFCAEDTGEGGSGEAEEGEIMDKISNLGEDAIKEALREMVIKYGRFSKETARNIMNTKIAGKLSETVVKLRS